MKIKISEKTKAVVKEKAKWLVKKWQFWAAIGGFYCVGGICGAVASAFTPPDPPVAIVQEVKVEETKEVLPTYATAETIAVTAEEEVVSEVVVIEEESEVIESKSESEEIIESEPKVVEDAETVAPSPAESKPEEIIAPELQAPVSEASATIYILNTNPERLKIHSSGSGQCGYVKKIAVEHYAESTLSLEALQAQGYTLCQKCH